MADLKHSNNLFLGKQEIAHLKKSLKEFGYEKILKDVIEEFGVVRDFSDTNNFTSLKIVEGTVGTGQLTVKAGYAIDRDLNIIEAVEDLVDEIQVPSDSTDYYIVISYQDRIKEQGIIQIGVNGELTGTGTKFTEVLRGLPNFPSKIKFPDSLNNTLEYSVANVISDTEALLNVPINFMVAESEIKYSVVGTFTPTIEPTVDQKFPFVNNGINFQLLDNISGITEGEQFVLAKVNYDGVTLTVEDQRRNNTFSALQTYLPTENPIMGVESITYSNKYSDLSENRMKIGWGLKITDGNYTVDTTSKKSITVTELSGGIYEDIADFLGNESDLVGWFLYQEHTRTFTKITTVTDLGGSLKVDFEYAQNIATGGKTVIAPFIGNIQIKTSTTSHPDNYSIINYPILNGDGIVKIKPGVVTKVEWRFLYGKITSQWYELNDGEYYAEDQFDEDANLTGVTKTAYSGSEVTGLLKSTNYGVDGAKQSQVNDFTKTMAISGNFVLKGFDSGLLGTATITPVTYTGFIDKNNGRFLVTNQGLSTGEQVRWSGFDGGEDGKLVIVFNNSASESAIELFHDNSESDAQDRFILPNNRNIILNPGDQIQMIYDDNVQKWRPKGNIISLNDEWFEHEILDDDIIISDTTNGVTTDFILGSDPLSNISGETFIRYKILGKTLQYYLRVDGVKLPSHTDAFDIYSIQFTNLPFAPKNAHYNSSGNAGANQSTVLKGGAVIFNPGGGATNQLNLLCRDNSSFRALNRYYDFSSSTSINVSANGTSNDVTWSIRINGSFEIE